MIEYVELKMFVSMVGLIIGAFCFTHEYKAIGLFCMISPIMNWCHDIAVAINMLGVIK